jgi:hypothetical protein
MSVSHKKVILCINEARSLKHYSVDILIDSFKKVEI